MAGGFYVNTEHLGYFAEQVDRNRAYAREAQGKLDLSAMGGEVRSSGGAVTALHYLVPSIDKWVERAYEDNESAIKALDTSARGLEYSKKYYEKLDMEKHAELDRLYDNNYGRALTTGPVRPSTFSFPGAQPIGMEQVRGWSSGARPQDYIRDDYHRQPLYPLTERDPKTEASKVFGEDWILSVDEAKGNIEDKLPSLSLIREVLNTILGENVVEWISEFIAGDWLAVDKLMRAFHWHGQVQQDIHDNLMRGLFAMQGMWTGGAGEAMQTAMQHLVQSGIKPHAGFLWQVRDRINEFAKATYHTFKVVEAFINTAIDLLEPVSTAKLVGKALDKLIKGVWGLLWGKWGEVKDAVGKLSHAAHMIGAIEGYASALSGSPSGATVPGGFRHPADTDRDHQVGAGELKGK